MIDVVLVAGDDDTGGGVQRLLELDGDVQVVGVVRSLEEAEEGSWGNAVVVAGPGIVESADNFVRISTGHRQLVVLTPGLARTDRRTGVIEVAMELTGATLRAAVRKAADDSEGS